MKLLNLICAPILIKLLGWQMGWLGLAVFTVIYYWLPERDSISEKGNLCEYESEHNNQNPLYVRGFFREKKKESLMFSQLKGLYECQIASLILLALVLIYYCVKNSYKRMLAVEIILIILFAFLLISWCGIKLYYRQCYRQDFRYVENENGIWKPFSFILQPARTWASYKPFHCQYHVPYEELKINLEKTAVENGYKFEKSYKQEGNDELIFFIRPKDDLSIFAVIHVNMLFSDSWEQFNQIFEQFWKEKIEEKYDTKSVLFTFLICVDEYSKELRKNLYKHCYCVDSAPGRYRLPAILAYDNNASLDIPEKYSSKYNQKEYRKMKRELMEMLNLSMRFNGKEYPEDACFEDEIFW